jgi:2-amino-4-deoxychorismate synthase
MSKRLTLDLLRFLSETPESYALLCRSDGKNGTGSIELILGQVRTCQTIQEIRGGTRSLVVVPFRQVVERGFECKDDNKPILVLDQTSSQTLDRRLLADCGAGPLSMHTPMSFDQSDIDYANIVKLVIGEEIGEGECSNVVISRQLLGQFGNNIQHSCLTLFCNIIAIESGFYWAFLIRTPELTLLGATPEKHVKFKNGLLSMTAISGTESVLGGDSKSILHFLSDQKEQYELCMVVDEELKMMSRCCSSSLKVEGPFLRAMRNLIHTEYELRGQSHIHPTTALFETMFAPSVVGSPLQNAVRVIARRESEARSYYSGFIALVEENNEGTNLDSAIIIRTAEVKKSGLIRFQVGSTITRASSGIDEARETQKKAATFLAAINFSNRIAPGVSIPIAYNGSMDAALKGIDVVLSERSSLLSRFWMEPTSALYVSRKSLNGILVGMVDFEDNFTYMWARILEALGATVEIIHYTTGKIYATQRAFDVVILGPGPGTPLDVSNRRQATLNDLIDILLDRQQPTLAVCLAHQALCMQLGFSIRRRITPNQGVQRGVKWRGRLERVGFYNTFEAWPEHVSEIGGVHYELSPDGAIDSLAMPRVLSIQFHPESILTTNGHLLIYELMEYLISDCQ